MSSEDTRVAGLENEVREALRGVQLKYFPELTQCVFQVEKRDDFDGVQMRVVFGVPVRVYFYYGDDEVLERKYRMGLIPLAAHELAHLIDPANPDRVLEERLPKEMVGLWGQLRDAGLAVCSMDV